jgi:long-chain acyl-CoA synthetase
MPCPAWLSCDPIPAPPPLLCSQIWVYGNSYESVLVAVVVPVKSKLLALAEEQGIQGGLEEVCGHPAARQIVLQAISVTGEGSTAQGGGKGGG